MNARASATPSTSGPALRILLVEDSADDAELVLRQFRRAGFVVDAERVETAEAMRDALRRRAWDVILADYSLPRFGARAALDVLADEGIDVPFVVVSGAIGEEAAASVMKAGADDYVPKGNLTRLVSAVERELRDAARRKERAELVALAARLGRLLDQSPDEVFVFERDSLAIRQVNRGACEHLGYSREELLGCSYRELCAEPGSGRLDAILAAARRGEQTVFEAEHRRKGGATYPVEVRVRLSPEEEPPVYLAIAQDITARRRAEVERAHMLERERRLLREAQDAVRVRDDFLSVAAHELRTPITSLRLAVQALERALRQGPDGALETLLAVVDRSAQRLHRLGEDLLDGSQIAMGRLPLRLEDVDLASVVETVVDELAIVMPEARRKITVRVAPVVGRWDRRRVEQLVRNLLTNAVKYGRGRPITVAVEERDGAARLRVEDQGIGIPAESRSRIFGRFERAAASSSYGGLGLGLHVARSIADLHGGSIEVDSVVGEGSTFTVWLPRSGPERTDAPERVSHA